MNGLREYIIALRKAQGISQSEMADFAELSRKGWIDYETGRTADLKSAVVFRVLDRLDVSIEDMAAAIGVGRAMPDDALNDVLDLARDLSDVAVDEWIEYGRYLQEGK